jgi:TolA-binding protein
MEKEEKKVEEVIEKKDETIVEPKKDNEKTAEELKAEAEALEAEIKELKEKGQGDEYKNNQLIRLEKARAKKEALLGTKEVDKKTDDVDTRDLIILAKHDIGEDSEKAKILAKYKAGGLIKDYSEGLNHIAIKAEFEALDAVNNAKTVIDENDTDEVKVKTTKEVINSYRNSGEVPSDVKLQKAIAEDNLKTMGI